MKYLIILFTIFLISSSYATADEFVELESLIQEALTNNPEINASRNKYLSATKKPSQESSLPNPIVGTRIKNVGFDEITLGDDPRSDIQFFFNQEIPFPTKLFLKEKIALKNADFHKWMSDATTRRVISELKSTYFDWFFINKSIEITKNNKELLSKFAKIAEVKYEVGNGIQQDVLKAQVEVSRFIERLELLNEKNKITEFKINKILNRPINSSLGIPKKVVKTDFSLTLDEITNLTLKNAPIIKSSTESVNGKEESLKLAQTQYLPDFLIGANYFNRSGGSQNLDDLWQLSLGLRIPLYFWRKERLGVEGASFDLIEAKNNHNSISNNLILDIKDNFLTAKTAEKLLDLYSSGIIPQSSLSLESATSGYQVGDVDFLTLLNNLITLFNFELQYYDQLTIYQKALVRIEELSGLEIFETNSLNQSMNEINGGTNNE